jgi:hypothetical protein
MSQTINLNRYLGREATQQEKTLFAELAVETINNRTLDGRTIHGGKFKKYSEEYADKKGVSRDSVDLFLEGDMLDSVDANVSGPNVEITLGSEEAPKGYNHQVGDTLPKRQWFGITTTEARQIADQVRQPDPEPAFTLADLRAALALLDVEQDG